MILDDTNTYRRCSMKKVRVQCEECKEVRVIPYRTAMKSIKKRGTTFCKKCGNKGERNSFFGKKHSEETLKILKEKLTGENNPLYGKKRPNLSGEKHPFFGKKRPPHIYDFLRGEENPSKKLEVRMDNSKRMIENNPMKNPETLKKVSGKNHWNWKPPEERKQKLDKQIRALPEYKKWRFKCFERDNFTCVECGNTKSFLNVDHIKPFFKILKEHNIKNKEDAQKCVELWDLNNGRTLCEEDHRKTDTFGGKAKRKK